MPDEPLKCHAILRDWVGRCSARVELFSRSIQAEAALGCLFMKSDAGRIRTAMTSRFVPGPPGAMPTTLTDLHVWRIREKFNET